MRIWMKCCLTFIAFLLVMGPSFGGADTPVAEKAAVVSTNQSLKNEVSHAITRGLRWLHQHQEEGGFWSQPDHPALTALVLTAFAGDPDKRFTASHPVAKKGYDYLLQCVKPDGGIYVKDLANYNTSVSMVALQSAGDPAFEPVLRNARQFIIGLQDDARQPGVADGEFDGGVGYGGRYPHSDMSNTMFALEALYYTRYLNEDTLPTDQAAAAKKLNWSAALTFIQRCQNLPGSNDQSWASDDPANRGGFVYFPGNSKAGEVTLPSGKIALRSYGSISYAGLLSYVYAKLDKDDPRVQAVLGWLQKNYTLEENPGMGQQGLFYYLHTMGKALTAARVDQLTLADGRTADWRRELALRLFDLQQSDGSWVNENGRWWEKDPVLVTSYAVVTLETLYRGM